MALVEVNSNNANFNKEKKLALFGEFTSKPSEFIFLPDEKETIMNIVRHVRERVDKPTENSGLMMFLRRI